MSKFFDFLHDGKSTTRTFVNLDRVLAVSQVSATTPLDVHLGGGITVGIPVYEASRFIEALRSRS